jgi:hypothetical protein
MSSIIGDSMTMKQLSPKETVTPSLTQAYEIINRGNALLLEVASELEKGSKGNSDLIADKLERAKALFQLAANTVPKEYRKFDAMTNPEIQRDCGNGIKADVSVRAQFPYQYASYMAEMMDKVGSFDPNTIKLMVKLWDLGTAIENSSARQLNKDRYGSSFFKRIMKNKEDRTGMKAKDQKLDSMESFFDKADDDVKKLQKEVDRLAKDLGGLDGKKLAKFKGQFGMDETLDVPVPKSPLYIAEQRVYYNRNENKDPVYIIPKDTLSKTPTILKDR